MLEHHKQELTGETNISLNGRIQGGSKPFHTELQEPDC